MNLTTALARLRKIIGNPAAADVADADLTTILNDAHRDVATKYRHHKARILCEFETVEDQAEYGLPAKCGALLHVRDTDNKKTLERLGWRRFEAEASPTSGKPERYVRFRNSIYLDPPPDAAGYTIRLFYRENLTDLSAGGDTFVTPVTWDLGLLFFARWLYFDGQGDLPKAGYALNAWRTWLSDRSTEIEEEMVAADSGVELPTLGSTSSALDFDESP